MDVLAQVLDGVRLSGALTLSASLGAPWGFDKARRPGIHFHVVPEGEAWLSRDGAPPRRLGPGDVALVLDGAAHGLSSEPGAPRRPFADLLRDAGHPPRWPGDADPGPLLHLAAGGDGPRTRLLSGLLALEDGRGGPLLAGLPPLLVVPGEEGAVTPPVARALAALTEELAATAPGGAAVARRLGEVLFVQILRRCIAGADPGASGWLRGIGHPRVGRALARLHAEPGRAWTVPALAAEIGTSRSRLAEDFARITGQPVGRYLTGWRMELAARRLASPAPPPPLADLAEALGYESDLAFAKAFRRWSGTTPRAYRRAALAGEAPPPPGPEPDPARGMTAGPEPDPAREA